MLTRTTSDCVSCRRGTTLDMLGSPHLQSHIVLCLNMTDILLYVSTCVPFISPVPDIANTPNYLYIALFIVMNFFFQCKCLMLPTASIMSLSHKSSFNYQHVYAYLYHDGIPVKCGIMICIVRWLLLLIAMFLSYQICDISCYLITGLEISPEI